MRRLSNWFPVVVVLLLLAGCGSSEKPLSPAERFKKEQAVTVTPHERIVLETVRDTADGRIFYQTTDGSKWIVEFANNADGSVRYSAPVQTKD